MIDRYTDKPFLRFIDAWVLKAIGHLDPATESYCQAMVPQLEQSFGVTGSWERIVEQQMKFGPELPAQILKIWTDGRSEEHTYELQSLMRTSFAVFCLKYN